MRSAFAKEVTRSIRGSLGRFLAIMGIVALGCGFFAGLQMCGPDMRAAGDALYDGTNLWDLRLISTLGFSDDDAERMQKVTGVRAVMPSVTYDAMARLGSEQSVVRLGSLDVRSAQDSTAVSVYRVDADNDAYLNRLFLREGTWPTAPDECVVSADEPSGLVAIGDTVELLYGTSDLDDIVRERSLRIVGTVSSSNYPYTGSFGATTLGSGMVDDYLYVAPAAFVDDAPYTEMYVTVEGAAAKESESDGYYAVVDGTKSRFEDDLDDLEQARLDDIRADAQAELDENRSDYESQKADATRELDDAKATLDDSRAKLESGQREYEDGLAQYNDGLAQYESGVAELQQRSAEGEAQLLDSEGQLAEARAQLDAGEAEYAEGERQLLDKLTAQDMPVGSLGEAEAALQKAQGQIAEGQRQIAELDEGIAQAQAGVDQLEEAVGDAPDAGQLKAEADQLQVASEQLGAQISQLQESGADEQTLAQLQDQKAQLDERLGSVKTALAAQEQLEALRQQLAGLQQKREEVEPQRKDLEKRAADVQQGLDGIAKLRESRAQLDTGWQTYRDGVAQLDAGRQQLADQTGAAWAQLDSAKAQLDDSSAQLASAKNELDSGRAKYEDGLAEYQANKDDADQKFADAEAELDDAQADIDALEPPDIYVLDRSQSEGAATYRADSERMDHIAAVFPAIFFLVAALVALTTMTRMVDDDRIQIGTYKALGYGTATIASKYLVYAGIASGVGAVVGIAVLTQVLPQIVINSYAIIYAVPVHPIPMPVSPAIVLAAGGLGVGVTLLATWLAVVQSLRATPATLMLPRAPKAGKRILLERIHPLWSRLSFSWKVTFRNLFRYKRRLLMTVIGISGCTALLLVGFGLHDSIWDIIDKQYGPIVHYNTTIGLKDDATDADVQAVATDLEATGQATDIIRVQRENLQAAGGKGQKTYQVTVMVPSSADQLSQTVSFRDRLSGQPVRFDDDSVLVTEKLASLTGVGVGDQIVIYDQDDVGNATGEGHELAVTGVVENYVGNLVYVGRDAWRSVDADEPVFSTILASVGGDEQNRASIGDALHDNTQVSTVIFSDETINTYRTMLKVIDLIVVVLVVSAGALAFIVLYNLTNINVEERVREIASLKVLGFTRREVYAYIFREVLLLAAIGDVVGMFLGTWLETFTITAAEVDYVMFGREIHPASYAISFAITLAFAAAIVVLMRHKLDRVNMVESLKSVD